MHFGSWAKLAAVLHLSSRRDVETNNQLTNNPLLYHLQSPSVSVNSTSNQYIGLWKNVTGQPEHTSSTLTGFKEWWEVKSKGRSGLLVYLVPALIAQISILRRVTPFIFGITSQYIDPINLFTYYSLKNKYMLHYAKRFTLACVGFSFVSMMIDLYFGGSLFIPLVARSDSYALITGYVISFNFLFLAVLLL